MYRYNVCISSCVNLYPCHTRYFSHLCVYVLKNYLIDMCAQVQMETNGETSGNCFYLKIKVCA